MNRTYMERALALAVRGYGFTETNPLVGCVIVKNGTVVGEGWHKKFGGPHAEVNALALAGRKAKGATMYVTLEPCSHHGKTPPCAEAIIKAGLSEVVVAMRDPNPQVSGRGLKLLRQHGIAVRTGMCRKQALQLNPVFVRRHTGKQPFVTLKIAQTLDGRIADAHGKSKWITGPESRRQVQLMRSYFDAVLVGAGTVLADDPRLDARVRGGRNPWRIVLDEELRIPLKARLITGFNDGRTIVVTRTGASARKTTLLEKRGVTVWKTAADRRGLLAWRDILKLARDAGIMGILVEGGSTVFSSALKAGIADMMDVFVAPRVLGDGLPALVHTGTTMEMIRELDDVNVTVFGKDYRMSGYLQKR